MRVTEGTALPACADSQAIAQESDGLCWSAVRDFVAAVCALQSERG